MPLPFRKRVCHSFHRAINTGLRRYEKQNLYNPLLKKKGSFFVTFVQEKTEMHKRGLKMKKEKKFKSELYILYDSLLVLLFNFFPFRKLEKSWFHEIPCVFLFLNPGLLISECLFSEGFSDAPS